MHGIAGDDSGWMLFGGAFMWLFWILLIVVIVIIVKAITASGSEQPAPKSAMDILRERYARGEIDDEEFERKRRELEQ